MLRVASPFTYPRVELPLRFISHNSEAPVTRVNHHKSTNEYMIGQQLLLHHRYGEAVVGASSVLCLNYFYQYTNYQAWNSYRHLRNCRDVSISDVVTVGFCISNSNYYCITVMTKQSSAGLERVKCY